VHCPHPRNLGDWIQWSEPRRRTTEFSNIARGCRWLYWIVRSKADEHERRMSS
jgi:hypothetical protein